MEEGRVGGRYEVEEDILWARSVLEDGEDGGHGAANVGGIEGHGDVDDVV